MTDENFLAWSRLLGQLTFQLKRIADVLEEIARPAEPEPTPTEPTPCPHPLENRLDFGTTNNQPDWQCGICGYRTVTP